MVTSLTRKLLTLSAGSVLAVTLLWDPGALGTRYLRWLANGMALMATLFHEVGHTLMGWIFGYPTLPSFDFVHGGGMAWHFGRQVPLQWGMIALGAWGVWWVWVRDARWGIAAAASYAALLAASLTGFHDVIILFMGHGAEVLVGSFILARVLADGVPNRPLEFEIHALAGTYLILTPIHLSWGLATDSLVRDEYWRQKGLEGFGDFSRIASHFGLASEIPVAWFCLGFAVCMAVLTGIVAWRHRSWP